MEKCFRCGEIVPAPDLKEALAREEDWREFAEHNYEAQDDERVLICIPCADELDDLHSNPQQHLKE